MRRLCLFLLQVVFVLATASRVHADDLDDFIRNVMQQRHIPALSFAVVKDGLVVRTGAYGDADIEHEISARPDTVFKIGSVSKQFLAAGIMLLVQDGKIALSDRVSKYFPDAPSTWQDITIRHLLTHTSGLVREAPDFDGYKIQTDSEVIRSAYSVPLQFKTGDRYEYSNLGYFILAEVIHRVSGETWETFLRNGIFGPLGMTLTRVTSSFDIVPHRARGYVWNMDEFNNAVDWPAIRPSGAFMSTSLDMAKWEAALQTDKILTNPSKIEMWTPVKLNDGKTYPYGFGWELDDFPPGGFTTGVPSIRHEGTIQGFRAAFSRLPKQGLGVIVLSNLDRAALDSIVAGIAIRFAPDVLPAALQRWNESALK